MFAAIYSNTFMVSPIRKEMTHSRQAKPPIKNSRSIQPHFIHKRIRFLHGINCRYEGIDLYCYLLSFYLYRITILLLGEDYDTVSVVCAVRLNIRSVMLDL